MEFRAKVVDPQKIVDQMRKLTKDRVLVGVPDANAPRSAEEDEARKESGEPVNNAEIGYINEFGVPERNIPARPHLIPGIKSSKDRLAKVLNAGARDALKGNDEAAQIALTKVGIIAETAVKNRIDEGPFVPLSFRTVEARKARGRTGEKPLIDTGQYRNSITHVVETKENS